MLLVCGISCHLYLRMHQRTGLITCDIWWFILTTIFKVAVYFSTECVRTLEENTHNTWNKLERSRVIPHSFTTDANTPFLFEMRVCFTEWHCSSWPSWVVRDCLIFFRILDSMSLLTIICLEYGLGSMMLFFLLFILYKLSCQSSSLYI